MTVTTDDIIFGSKDSYNAYCIQPVLQVVEQVNCLQAFSVSSLIATVPTLSSCCMFECLIAHHCFSFEYVDPKTSLSLIINLLFRLHIVREDRI